MKLHFWIVCLFTLVACAQPDDSVVFNGVDYYEKAWGQGNQGADVEYVLIEKPAGTDAKLKLAMVLHYYGLEYSYNDNGEVTIPKKHLKDMNLLWNITLKAQSYEWLQSHIYTKPLIGTNNRN